MKILKWFILIMFYSNIILQQSYTTHIQVFQVTSFSFINKPSSDLSLSGAIHWGLSLHVGLRSYYCSLFIIKLYWNKLYNMYKIMEFGEVFSVLVLNINISNYKKNSKHYVWCVEVHAYLLLPRHCEISHFTRVNYSGFTVIPVVMHGCSLKYCYLIFVFFILVIWKIFKFNH